MATLRKHHKTEAGAALAEAPANWGFTVITEDQLEQLCLDWFKAIGYDYACGYDIAPDGDAPERASYRQVVLFERLIRQLQVLTFL